MKIAILGLGEAGSHFANDLAKMGVEVFGFDPNLKRILGPSVFLAKSNAKAAEKADIIFSVNLASVAEEVAHEVASVLNKKQIYLDMNTASPKQKIAVFDILKPTGVQFVDLAIMAPVPPKGIKTPFLACGEGADLFCQKMQPYGLNIEVLEGKVGDAATKKLLRSIVYKGIAAVICEAVESGQAFGMEDYIRAQIRSIMGEDDALIDRFLEGSKTHAERRMHEMEAVVEMLQSVDIQPFMSEAAIENLRKMICK